MGKLVVPGYYRNFKGNIYRTLHVVKHTETGEKMVIYQAMYGKGEIWARPKSMFMDEGRFTHISDAEAIPQIPLELNPKYHFPDLEYKSEIVDLIDADTFSSPVKSMITLLIKKNIVSNKFFDGFWKDDDIEKEAIRRIVDYSNGKNLEDIFHLIQVWGGNSGRGIYIFGDGYDWSRIAPHYQFLVDSCMEISDLSPTAIENMVKAVSRFNSSVANMGIAFITKHTRFWLYRTLGENALPIYDSIMANCVMRKNAVEIKHLAEYWNVMIAKARQKGISLVALERRIFKYAYDNR